MNKKNELQEPIRHFVAKYGVDVSRIETVICGHRYSAVLLKNGNIGVCANLLQDINVTVEDLQAPDLDDTGHRIILNAYFNGLLNYGHDDYEDGDIFDAVDFKRHEHIVMVGLFKPVVDKFKAQDIDIHVFDKIQESDLLVPIEDELAYIKKAGAVILTATSIFNGTFMEIIDNTGENCDIFLLGPSAIMDRDMFRYRNIKKIFGAIFPARDERMLDAVTRGLSTKEFIRYGRKVSI